VSHRGFGVTFLVGAGAALALGAGAARASGGGARPVLRHDVASSTSSNWAGYAVSDSGAGTTSFTSVSGSWVQPAMTCTSGAAAYAAFWVGLGGFAGSSQALEQIGTEADCTASGRATYSAWYEIVPSPSVPLALAVDAGDTLTGSVTVDGTSVTLTLTDQTTGQTATKTLVVASPETTSAEWIAEAPSTCGRGGCRTLPLANFGSVTFSSASATGAGHAGAIGDAAWGATAVTLRGSSAFPFGRSRFAPAQTVVSAVPGTLSSDGASFGVTYQQAVSNPQTGRGRGRRWGY
jgi:Peptidase A4 family